MTERSNYTGRHAPRPEASEPRPGTARPQQGGRSERARSEQNLLTLDFAEDSAADSSYSFSVDGKSLTLDTNTGTVYRLTRR